MPNSDGLDIDHCRNVRITECHIEAGDDNIVIKTTRGAEHFGPCENIVVSRCTLKSTSSALCIGCEIASPVRHVIFDSCVIASSHRGLSINHSFESDIEDVLFSNIEIETRLFNDRWWGKGEPIYVKALPWTEKDKVGKIRNVRFENIKARGENGILVWGETPDRIENIHFENVQLTLDKWTKYPSGRLDLRPVPGKHDGYATGLLERPTCAVCSTTHKRVTLHKFDVAFGESIPPAGRIPIETDNIQDLRLSDFTSRFSS